jgi:hypothetical protein
MATFLFGTFLIFPPFFQFFPTSLPPLGWIRKKTLFQGIELRLSLEITTYKKIMSILIFGPKE